MAMSGSSGLGHVLMFLLLLSTLFHHTESALPSDHEQLSITDKRDMERNGSSKLGHVLMFLLLLTFLLHHTESTLPYEHEQLSITGRRIMAYYKHNGAIGAPPSRSGRGGGHGRKLMGIYRPNGDIYTGPSNSGHGGGHIHQHSSP